MGYFDKFNKKGIPFMDNRDKGDLRDILDQPVHIEDFGFIQGDEGEYAVIAVKETPEVFYFCNPVITDMIKQVEKDGMKDELPAQVIKFSLAESKKGREYFRFEFAQDDISAENCISEDDIPF